MQRRAFNRQKSSLQNHDGLVLDVAPQRARARHVGLAPGHRRPRAPDVLHVGHVAVPEHQRLGRVFAQDVALRARHGVDVRRDVQALFEHALGLLRVALALALARGARAQARDALARLLVAGLPVLDLAGFAAVHDGLARLARRQRHRVVAVRVELPVGVAHADLVAVRALGGRLGRTPAARRVRRRRVGVGRLRERENRAVVQVAVPQVPLAFAHVLEQSRALAARRQAHDVGPLLLEQLGGFFFLERAAPVLVVAPRGAQAAAGLLAQAHHLLVPGWRKVDTHKTSNRVSNGVF